jgi:4'-phosphopantetheinyl transferase
VADIDEQWGLPPPNLVLSSDAVHVWRASLAQSPERVYQLSQTLSHDERMRAQKFRFKRDRRRFVVGRGVLRTILGRYLGIDSHQLRFRTTSRGKPYLAVERPGSCLPRFNLAHSHEVALYAFTCSREIGVDLEYVRTTLDVEELAASFFSTRENAALCSLPEPLRVEAFYNCWTRKEAYLKAVGEGLTRSLDQFEVSLVPGHPARLVHVEAAPQETGRWVLRALVPQSGYVAAIAVEGHDWRLECWQWT